MPWHVRFSLEGKEQIDRYPTAEKAIEVACLMIDAGRPVDGIGVGDLEDSIGSEGVARIYQLWVAAKGPSWRGKPAPLI